MAPLNVNVAVKLFITDESTVNCPSDAKITASIMMSFASPVEEFFLFTRISAPEKIPAKDPVLNFFTWPLINIV